MRGMTTPKDPKTEQTATIALPLKPFTELTDEERSSLSVDQLEAYKAQAIAEQKKQKKEYRNLLNKLKREADLAKQSPWENRERRNQFLYRLGVGALYYLAELKGEKADELFGHLVSHVAGSDKAFTNGFYGAWSAAGFPTEQVKKENEARDKRAANAVAEKEQPKAKAAAASESPVTK